MEELHSILSLISPLIAVAAVVGLMKLIEWLLDL